MKIMFDGEYTFIDFGKVAIVISPTEWIIMAILIIAGIYLLLTGC